MSADSAVTYTSVHSEARSWSIPSEDPYEEAARQLLEQAPRSPEYVPDPIELEDHVPVYIPEPEHPEDLVLAEDEAPTPHLPPSFLNPHYPPHVLEHHGSDEATAPSTYYPLLHQDPTIPSCEVGESSAAAAARQPGPTMSKESYSFYQVDVRSRESSEFYSRHHDAQKDRAAVRAEIEHTAALGGGGTDYNDTDESTTPRVAPSCWHYMHPVKFLWVLPQLADGVAAAMAEAEASRIGMCYNVMGSGPKASTSCSQMRLTPEFLKCKPLDFKGTKGVVRLTRWFEKMKSVFSISNYIASCQVKFTTCTLQDDALTWWNAHVKTTTPEAAHAMPWATLKKMMTDKYYPRGEIKKIETEMMFLEEVDKIEKYIGGLPDMILGSVKASKPKQQELSRFTTE
ncbi:putative reverse transcriptase domain-containing protein [Tanacetum coccineum]